MSFAEVDLISNLGHRGKSNRNGATHEAFVAMDDMEKNLDWKARYAVVRRLGPGWLTDNCVAACSPEVGGLVSNDKALSEQLQTLAGSYGGNG